MLDMPESLRVLIESDLPPTKKCFSFLKKAIFLGYLKKGQHIVERDIVDLLKISRSPIREAIRQLEGENLVAHYHNKGCIVIGLTARDIKEISELRRVLECFLAQKLSDGTKTAKLQELRDLLRKEHIKGMAHTINFHQLLLEIAEHTWLNRFLGQLAEYIEQFHIFSYLRQGREDEAHTEHIAILDALLAKDAVKAQQLMSAHIEASQRSFLQVAPLL